jgi:hypothetical protein
MHLFQNFLDMKRKWVGTKATKSNDMRISLERIKIEKILLAGTDVKILNIFLAKNLATKCVFFCSEYS